MFCSLRNCMNLKQMDFLSRNFVFTESSDRFSKKMALHDVMHTSNPIYDYAFSWTIDNFSRTSLTVQGPPFSPIPGYPDKFCFELKCSSDFFLECLYVDLVYLNAREFDLNVAGNITLRNTDTISIVKVTEVKKVDQITSLTIIRPMDLPKSINRSVTSISDFALKGCELTMQGTLQFSGYGISSTTYSPAVQQPSEEVGELLTDFKTLYDSGLAYDVTFSFGEEKLRAHKAILSVRSPVFAKMFEHDMLENNTNNVVIEDIDLHTFNCFLVFLYTAVLKNDKRETAKSLYSVAQKYQVKSLQNACIGIFGDKLEIEYVCTVLVLADLHQDEELKRKVKIFIRKNFFDIAGTTEWIELVATKPKLAEEVLGYIKSLHN